MSLFIYFSIYEIYSTSSNACGSVLLVFHKEMIPQNQAKANGFSASRHQITLGPDTALLAFGCSVFSPSINKRQGELLRQQQERGPWGILLWGQGRASSVFLGH